MTGRDAARRVRQRRPAASRTSRSAVAILLPVFQSHAIWMAATVTGRAVC